jgi:hypothetical protein
MKTQTKAIYLSLTYLYNEKIQKLTQSKFVYFHKFIHFS